ncbi:hypothetical protein HID58_042862, partial [Brassica napus]
DIVDSAQKNTDVSSCHPDLDVDREITMKDFLKLKEFLELEDGEKLEDLDSKRMYMSKASHLAVPKHQRPPIWTEEAVGFHKRVKRIHDLVKIVAPCAVVEVESPIPPDRICSSVLTL